MDYTKKQPTRRKFLKQMGGSVTLMTETTSAFADCSSL